uniref:ABC-type glutathione-S-conjugate transporter n=1 Tax=Tetranychus urticae TaxID=32264 RepID=T1KXB4_TETUR
MILEKYCGHLLWDKKLAWDTSSPILSPCFSETLLLWFPSFAFFFAVPFVILSSTKSSKLQLEWTFKLVFKLILSLTLIISNIYELISVGIQSRHTKQTYPYQYCSPLIKLVSFTTATYLLLLCKRKGIQSSGLLFIFWMSMVIQSSINYWTVIATLLSLVPLPWTYGQADFTLKTLQIVLILSIYLLNWSSDSLNTNCLHIKSMSPYASSSFLSRITFHWYNSMAYLGYRKTLESKDVWSIPEQYETSNLEATFDNLLARGQSIAIKSKEGQKQQTQTTGLKYNLFGEFVKKFWPWLFLCTFFKLIASLSAIASPQILDFMLTFISSDDPTWKGIILVKALIISAILQSIFDSQYEFWIQVTSIKIRSALISVIYRKSLLLSGEAKRNYKTGQIVNLMAVDVQHIVDCVNMVNIIWIIPIQLTIANLLLWKQLGVATVSGIICMLILIPLNLLVTNIIKKIQAKIMSEKDQRAKLMSEILNGMKVLKLYAWEKVFADLIVMIRSREIKNLKRQAIWSGIPVFLFLCFPFIVMNLATFTLIDSNNILTANKAFVSLSLLNILRHPMGMLPMVVSHIANFIISIKRINAFLKCEELDSQTIKHDTNEETPITVKDATFCWSTQDEPVLHSINLSVGKAKLIAIVGPIGSGKSSLLASLLGDLHKVSGSVNVYGKVGYVPQLAWIQNTTLRDNIIFGQPYCKAKFDQILDACALRPDLAILPADDLTEIGERGVNLSGGQKQRISFARAVYANCDVVLLDDPLSAVDVHVASHLFNQVIGPNGLLKDKTRLLVTHRLSFLPQVDQIIVLKGGKISEMGTYNELLKQKGEFSQLVLNYLVNDDFNCGNLSEDFDDNINKTMYLNEPRVDSSISQIALDYDRISQDSCEYHIANCFTNRNEFENNKMAPQFGNKLEIDSINRLKQVIKNLDSKDLLKVPGQLIEKEQAEIGGVKWRVYLNYFKTVGFGLISCSVGLFIASNGCNLGANLWLSKWSEDYLDSSKANDTSMRLSRLGVYSALGALDSIFFITNAIILNFAILNGAVKIHKRMLQNIIQSPMAFFDTTPMGRVLNRFTMDIDVADYRISMSVRFVFNNMISSLTSIIGIVIENGYVIIVIAIVFCVYLILQKFYLASSRQLKRIQSITRSPVYAHFSETITGTTLIRTYGMNDKFIEQCYQKVDINNSCVFLNAAAIRWLAIRLDFLGQIVVAAVAIFAVLSRNTTNQGTNGLALSYALLITQALNYMSFAFSLLEIDMISIERCLEYTELESEADWINYTNRPSDFWPHKGEIVFKDYSTRYRPGLDKILNNINLKIKATEKVGIVGRTGAGKSSLTLGLFRLIEPCTGMISIDGQDICTVGLHDLRSKLTVIPQDLVLFSASFRTNLDPFNRHSDSEIWKVLEQTQLRQFVNSHPSGLDYIVAEGGENLSIGQRQLFCLARALLRRSKILVLDEATAAVDIETDKMIQSTIRREFADCTIITIAHRLNTIMDYDKIIVLSEGKLIEYDSPANLLADVDSKFYSMVQEAQLL